MFSYSKIAIVGALCTAIICFSCKTPTSNGKDRISELMSIQEMDWNSGNIPGFMQTAYVDSDSLYFVGKSGLNKGYKRTLDNYLKSYPNTDQMGKLHFSNEVFKPLGKEHFLVIGAWELQRSQDTIGGYYSLVWEWINGDWKIIADHSS